MFDGKDETIRHQASALLPAAAWHGGPFFWPGTPLTDQRADPCEPHAVAEKPFEDAHDDAPW